MKTSSKERDSDRAPRRKSGSKGPCPLLAEVPRRLSALCCPPRPPVAYSLVPDNTRSSLGAASTSERLGGLVQPPRDVFEEEQQRNRKLRYAIPENKWRQLTPPGILIPAAEGKRTWDLLIMVCIVYGPRQLGAVIMPSEVASALGLPPRPAIIKLPLLKK